MGIITNLLKKKEDENDDSVESEDYVEKFLAEQEKKKILRIEKQKHEEHLKKKQQKVQIKEQAKDQIKYQIKDQNKVIKDTSLGAGMLNPAEHKLKKKNIRISESSLIKLSKDLGKLKAHYFDMQKKQTEIEVLTKKQAVMLEIIKPDFIEKIKQQDIAINSLKLELDSVKKLKEKLVDTVNSLKKKLDFYDYKRVCEIDKEAREKLRHIEKLNAIVEVDSRKVEDIFEEIEE